MKKFISVVVSFVIFCSVFNISLKAENILTDSSASQDFSQDTVLLILNQKYANINDSECFQLLKGTVTSYYDLTACIFDLLKKQMILIESTDLSDASEVIATKEELAKIGQKLKLVNIESYTRIFSLKLKTPGKKNVLELVDKLNSCADVLYAFPDYMCYQDTVTTNDTFLASQWAIDSLNMGEAWEFTTGENTVTVGVADSGLDHEHEEFEGRFSNIADEDFVYRTNTYDLNSHGTHVAGIIGASTNNNKGIAGVNWNVEIRPLRVFNEQGEGTVSALIEAINYAQYFAIPILNYSGGLYISATPNTDECNTIEVLSDALQTYNGLFICSAGNGYDHDNDKTTPKIIINDDSDYVHYPSGLTLNNVISVGAHDRYDNWHYNYSEASVDLAAPGIDICSTVPSGYNDAGYASFSGTSMATPYVTGVAALIMSLPGGEDFTPVQIKNFILNGTEPVAGFEDKCVTGGKLNAYLAIRNAIDNGKNPVVAGDFDGDGVDELAGFYGRNNYTALIYWENLGNKFDIQAGTVACVLPDFAVSRISGQIVAGDFNGDGVDEIGALYDYDTYLGLWTFTRQSNGKFIQKKIGDTGAFNDEGIRNRVTCGDLDGDGKDEMLALYYYSHSGNMGLWYFRPTATDTLELARAGLIYGLVPDCVDNRIAAGDFDGDGADEYGILYDHTTNYTEMILLDRASDGTFSHYTVGQTGTYNYEYTKGLISAGDYDGDGVDEMMTLYGYDLDVPHKALMKIWIFERLADGTMNLPRSDFYPTFYNPNIAYTMVTGKFSSATSRDTMAGIYDYGPYSKVWAFGYPAENTWTCTALV